MKTLYLENNLWYIPFFIHPFYHLVNKPYPVVHETQHVVEKAVPFGVPQPYSVPHPVPVAQPVQVPGPTTHVVHQPATAYVGK